MCLLWMTDTQSHIFLFFLLFFLSFFPLPNVKSGQDKLLRLFPIFCLVCLLSWLSLVLNCEIMLYFPFTPRNNKRCKTLALNYSLMRLQYSAHMCDVWFRQQMVLWHYWESYKSFTSLFSSWLVVWTNFHKCSMTKCVWVNCTWVKHSILALLKNVLIKKLFCWTVLTTNKVSHWLFGQTF